MGSSYVVVLCTCKRAGAYATGTLRSALRADPKGWSSAAQRIALVDGNDAQYLAEAAVRASVEVRTHAGEALGAYGNVLRSLQTGVQSGADAVVLLEDDLEFAPGWLGALARLGFTHVAPYFPEYVISGYVPYQLQPRASCRWLADYNVPFYASCCLFMPRAVAATLAEQLLRSMHLPRRAPADLSIARIAGERAIRIFGTVPSVAQHLGDESTLGTAYIRRSPTFGPIDLDMGS